MIHAKCGIEFNECLTESEVAAARFTDESKAALKTVLGHYFEKQRENKFGNTESMTLVYNAVADHDADEGTSAEPGANRAKIEQETQKQQSAGAEPPAGEQGEQSCSQGVGEECKDGEGKEGACEDAALLLAAEAAKQDWDAVDEGMKAITSSGKAKSTYEQKLATVLKVLSQKVSVRMDEGEAKGETKDFPRGSINRYLTDDERAVQGVQSVRDLFGEVS